MKALLIFALGMVLTSCVHQPAATPATTPHASAVKIPTGVSGSSYWWYARFKQPWPEQEDAPDFSKNLIVANEVIAPALAQHVEQIELWRFHRRAARDAAGHQFSFIFYASPETARSVFHSLRSNENTTRLIQNEVVLELRFDDPDVPRKSDIAGTSDPGWPLAIQKSWPYFIMGVSKMWLDLVELHIDQAALSGLTLPARLDYYQKVNDRLSELWREQGRHAFLHHISGMFGYEPIDLRF